MVEKKDGSIVIHLSKTMEMQFKAIAELDGLTASEKGQQLIQKLIADEQIRFEVMKTILTTKE